MRNVYTFPRPFVRLLIEKINVSFGVDPQIRVKYTCYLGRRSLKPKIKKGGLGLWRAIHINRIGPAKLNWRLVRDRRNKWEEISSNKYRDKSICDQKCNISLKPKIGSINMKALKVGDPLANEIIRC